MARRRCIVLVGIAILATPGCLDGLGVLPGGGFDADDVPGMGSVDLSQARATFDLQDCRELHLVARGETEALAEAVPDRFALVDEGERAGQLVVTIVECGTIHAGNDTFANASYFTVGTPIAATGETPGGVGGSGSGPVPDAGAAMRDDAIIAVGSPNTTLTAHLGSAGLPVEPVGAIHEERTRDYGIAEQTLFAVDTLSHSFDAQVTSVSIQVDVPFGVGPAIGRTGWVVDGDETLEMRRGVEVEELGGISATLEPDLSGRMADLTPDRTASAHGFATRFDARMGLVPANAGG